MWTGKGCVGRERRATVASGLAAWVAAISGMSWRWGPGDGTTNTQEFQLSKPAFWKSFNDCVTIALDTELLPGPLAPGSAPSPVPPRRQEGPSLGPAVMLVACLGWGQRCAKG